jgi:hypothetical protein
LIPLGFVDSLNVRDSSQPIIRYYRDRNCSVPFQSVMLANYWAGQPGMRLLTTPKHDIAGTVRSSWKFQLPFKTELSAAGAVQCLWYPEKVRWFSIDDTIPIQFFHLYDYYKVVYNAGNGTYYLNTDPGSRHYIRGILAELKTHEKTRIDCFISLTLGIEKGISNLGTVYFSCTYLKGFSTFSDNDPVATLDRFWNVQAGWKKDLSFTK